MILTSNRGFAEWGEVFGDTVVAHRSGDGSCRFSCASLFAAGTRAARMRPAAHRSRPRKGCRRARSSIDGDPSFSTHPSLCSAGFHRLHRSYEEIRLLGGHRLVVVAFFRPTAMCCHQRNNGPAQISPGNDTGCPAAPAPLTASASVGFWASRTEARSPGWDGLSRILLTFGAAVRLGLLPHTASRRQHRASHDGPCCVQLPPAHGCYQLAP